MVSMSRSVVPEEQYMARPSDKKTFLTEVWSAYVAVTLYQNNPSYGLAAVRAMESQEFANPAQRLLLSRSQAAISEWIRVWDVTWRTLPVEWRPLQSVLANALDVVIDAHAAVKQGDMTLYRSTIIGVDYRTPPTAVLSSLVTAYAWRNLVFWASLPQRVRTEVGALGSVPFKDLDQVTEKITLKLLPDILFLYEALPDWPGWLP